MGSANRSKVKDKARLSSSSDKHGSADKDGTLRDPGSSLTRKESGRRTHTRMEREHSK